MPRPFDCAICEEGTGLPWKFLSADVVASRRAGVLRRAKGALLRMTAQGVKSVGNSAAKVAIILITFQARLKAAPLSNRRGNVSTKRILRRAIRCEVQACLRDAEHAWRVLALGSSLRAPTTPVPGAAALSG